MSSDKDVPVPNEIVIVRRRAGFEEEGHHGGAWKIAFADLMTAMMTFFLVMWLLSVSDKEKITKIATYFNPTKLTDKRPTEKGVFEVNEDDEEKGVDAAKKIKAKEDPKSEAKDKAEKAAGDGKEDKGDPKKVEEELFNDPYGVLARMALKAITRGEKANGGTLNGEEALPGGEAYRNPFEPSAADRPLAPNAGQPGSAPGAEGEKQVEGKGEAVAVGPAPSDSPPAAKEVEAKQAQSPEKDLEREIIQSLASLAPENIPNIEVKRVDEGVLISLTDDFRFGMFAVSSATPKPEVVVVMEKVAKALAEREGQIVIRGHTDGRPFKSGKNENWRLSMARAQVAYFMLVRGGLQEARVERIEGNADRSLKVPSDPNAAQNRRIEILLRTPKP
jgi:chemotaxis protein MotB